MLRRNITDFAIVITHTTADRRLADASWLEAGYRVEESDWVHLSPDGWRAAADGDPAVWDALARKLMIGYYVRQPELIAVVGHADGGGGIAEYPADPDATAGPATVRRIARRVRSLLLPAAVLGFWVDELGTPAVIAGSAHDDGRVPAGAGAAIEEAEEVEAVA